MLTRQEAGQAVASQRPANARAAFAVARRELEEAVDRAGEIDEMISALASMREAMAGHVSKAIAAVSPFVDNRARASLKEFAVVEPVHIERELAAARVIAQPEPGGGAVSLAAIGQHRVDGVLQLIHDALGTAQVAV